MLWYCCRHHFRTTNEDFPIVSLTREDLERHSSLFRPYFLLPPRCRTALPSSSESGDGAAGVAAANKKPRVRVSKDSVDGDADVIKEVLALVSRITKDRTRKLFDRPSEFRNAAESVLVAAYQKMVEKVTQTVGEMVAQMDQQQVLHDTLTIYASAA